MSSITNYLRNIRDWIKRHAGKYPLLFAGGMFLCGIVFWGGFNWSMAISNSETFCISCHEMNDNVYREYQQSVHYHNRSGVRATCPDCHVPHEWTAMVVRKVRASNELFHTLAGSIDTREKFLAKRWKLAEIVWETMESNDSLECRNCHDSSFMKLQDQSPAAANAHRSAIEQGKTCIGCHKGVVHELPEDFLDQEHQRFEQDGTDCGQCHASLQRDEDGGGWY